MPSDPFFALFACFAFFFLRLPASAHKHMPSQIGAKLSQKAFSQRPAQMELKWENFFEAKDFLVKLTVGVRALSSVDMRVYVDLYLNLPRGVRTREWVCVFAFATEGVFGLISIWLLLLCVLN